MDKKMEALIEKARSLNWSVEDEGDHQYRFSKPSPAGQDFGISVEGEDAAEIIDNLYHAYNNFDVSEETYLWLDDSGHGKNGAPYDMKDVYLDMETCKESLLDLHTSLAE